MSENFKLLLVCFIATMLLFWFTFGQDYFYYFLTKWRSAPYNAKIAEAIAEGQEKIYLRDIYNDFEWDYGCVHSYYSNIKRTAGYCILDAAGHEDMKPTTENHLKAVTASNSYSFIPGRYKIVHDQSILLLVNNKEKKVYALVTEPDIAGTNIIKNLSEPMYYNITTNRFGHKYIELFKGE